MRVALVVVALVGVADVLAWKAHDIIYPQPTRLERATLCLTNNHGTVAVVPAADPLARSAGEGSLQATIEGNDVTVALASSEEQARKIERDYNTVASRAGGPPRTSEPNGLPVALPSVADPASGDVRLPVLRSLPADDGTGAELWPVQHSRFDGLRVERSAARAFVSPARRRRRRDERPSGWSAGAPRHDGSRAVVATPGPGRGRRAPRARPRARERARSRLSPVRHDGRRVVPGPRRDRRSRDPRRTVT